MLTSLLLIPLFTGFVFVVAGFLMFKFPPKKINGWYGYRTAASMKNQERWRFAQTYAAKQMMKNERGKKEKAFREQKKTDKKRFNLGFEELNQKIYVFAPNEYFIYYKNSTNICDPILDLYRLDDNQNFVSGFVNKR